MRLKDAVDQMAIGDEVIVSATDAGFESDAPAWCRKHGHDLRKLMDEVSADKHALRNRLGRAWEVAGVFV